MLPLGQWLWRRFTVTSQTLFIMIVTVIAAIFLLRTGQNTKIKGDSAIAMLSVGALAIGYLVMNYFFNFS